MLSGAILLIALVAAIAAIAAYKRRRRQSRFTHAWRIDSAGRVLDQLFDSRSGMLIRNPRYSGDGGVDGVVWIGKVRVLIQMKRYRSFVRAADVLEFARVCAARKAPGFFIHTGRTGKASWAGQSDHVRIISAVRLLRLLDPVGGNPFRDW